MKFALALLTFGFIFTLVHGILNQPQPVAAPATSKLPANPSSNRGTLT